MNKQVALWCVLNNFFFLLQNLIIYNLFKRCLLLLTMVT